MKDGVNVMSEAYLLSEEELRQFCKVKLEKSSMSEEDIATMVDITVKADLRGVSSHGVSRLDHYIQRMEKGLINPQPALNFEQRAGSVVFVDADNGLGQVVAHKAMSVAVEQAAEKGLCCVGIKNTNHIGLAGYYPEMAAKNKMMGFITANTNPAMAPFGGVQALFGTNPFAVAVPTKSRPILLDMATTNVARGKIRIYEKQNQEIPLGWAKDADGKDTTDPAMALLGTLSPVGGPKGYGMALLIDIIAGIMTGSKSCDGVCSLDDMSQTICSGNFLLAFNIECMINYNDYLDRVEELKEKIKTSEKADGVKELYLAGEIEYNTEERNRQNGLAVSKDLWEKVKKEIA
jgi:LDH2 family malate/lactate/ureidoglycolate dehydrogenase